jgi:IS30 family transposase
MVKEVPWQGVEKRLDAIINILLSQTQLQEEPTRNKIALLSSIGFSDSEIARILGRSRGYVSSELTLVRGRK